MQNSTTIRNACITCHTSAKLHADYYNSDNSLCSEGGKWAVKIQAVSRGRKGSNMALDIAIDEGYAQPLVKAHRASLSLDITVGKHEDSQIGFPFSGKFPKHPQNFQEFRLVSEQ